MPILTGFLLTSIDLIHTHYNSQKSHTYYNFSPELINIGYYPLQHVQFILGEGPTGLWDPGGLIFADLWLNFSCFPFMVLAWLLLSCSDFVRNGSQFNELNRQRMFFTLCRVPS